MVGEAERDRSPVDFGPAERPRQEPRAGFPCERRTARARKLVERLIAILLDEAGPDVLLRHDAGLVVRRLGALVGHLEEQ